MTAVFVLPLTVAVNGCVARVANVAVLGETLTLTCPRAYCGTAPSNSATTSMETKAVAFEVPGFMKGKFVIVFSPYSQFLLPRSWNEFCGGFKRRDGR